MVGPFRELHFEGCDIGYDIDGWDVCVTHLDGIEIEGPCVFIEDLSAPEDTHATLAGLESYIERKLRKQA